MDGYKRLFLDTEPTGGEGADDKVIVVVFTDLPADRAGDLFGDVQQQLALPSYAEDGILFGPFYKGNEGTALYNPSFRPFQSPVPFLFVRNGVVSDWKFFLDDEDWLRLWARRYGESGALALAEELRRHPWRRCATHMPLKGDLMSILDKLRLSSEGHVPSLDGATEWLNSGR